MVKLLVDEASTKIVSSVQELQGAGAPGCDRLVQQDPHVRGRTAQRAATGDGVAVAEAVTGPAGVAGAAAPARGDTYTRLAAGFGIGVATVSRYVAEVVDLLAALAPDVAVAVQAAAGKADTILDGTGLPIDRVGMRAKADRPYYSGKHKRHGLNVQILADPAGRPLWAGPALPGSAHDLAAAGTHGLTDAGVMVLADRGYQRARGTVRVPFLPAGPAVNTAHARLRAPGERAVATVRKWRLLCKIRSCAQRGTALAAAVLTLETATRS
jgi:hypothetical protein